MVNAHACGIFPAPFPDETCYSLLCRYAVRRGHLTSSQVCLDLFGHTEPLSGYLFKPYRKKDVLKWFAKRSSLPLPEFMADHSCYPFYAAFLEREDAEKVRHCRTGSVLTSGQAKRINRLCGFPRGHKKNLWYCPECVREDIALHGETCWRRLPQMPGAIWCPVHGAAFRESGTRLQDILFPEWLEQIPGQRLCMPKQIQANLAAGQKAAPYRIPAQQAVACFIRERCGENPAGMGIYHCLSSIRPAFDRAS